MNDILNRIIPFDKIKTFSFNRRNSPIKADLRVTRKISLILLILKLNSKGSKASLAKIHFFLWVLSDKDNMVKLENLENIKSLKYGLWIPNNIYNLRAIQIAFHCSLIEQTTNGFKLSDIGDNYVMDLINSNLMKNEIDFMKKFKKTITEKMIKEIHGVE